MLGGSPPYLAPGRFRPVSAAATCRRRASRRESGHLGTLGSMPRAMGCGRVRGFLLAEPMRARDLVSRLRA